MELQNVVCPKCQGRKSRLFKCSLCKGEDEIDYHSGRQWLQNQWSASRLRWFGVIFLAWGAFSYFMIAGQPLP